jgi:large subunit ribosomal protein L29
MKNHVIVELTEVELKKRETDLRDELRFQHHTGQLASPIKLRSTRRELARVLTRIRELELGINQAPVQE